MRTTMKWLATLSVAILLTSHSGTLYRSGGLLALALPVDPSLNSNPVQPSSPAPSDIEDSAIIDHQASKTTNTIIKNIARQEPETVQTKPSDMFTILNPQPNDIWTTGSIENIYWDSGSDLDGSTFDVTLIPVITEQDAKTWSQLPPNPQALLKTVRPVRRYVDPDNHNFDIVVPYNLVPRPLLEQHRQEALRLQAQELEQQKLGAGTPSGTKEEPNGQGNENKKMTAQFRVVLTAYEGKTNKKIAEASVFPVLVQLEDFSPLARVDMVKRVKDELENGRPMTMNAANEDGNLAKKDSALTHLDDGPSVEQPDLQHQHQVQEEGEQESSKEEGLEDVDSEGDDNEIEPGDSSESPTAGETDGEQGDGPEFEQGEPLEEGGDTHVHGHDEHGDGDIHEDAHEEGDDDDDGHDHGDDDGTSYEDLMMTEEELNSLPPDDPPPTILHAGALEITHWNDYKVRFFTGAPYVIGWDWSRTLLDPEDRMLIWDPEIGAKVKPKSKKQRKKRQVDVAEGESEEGDETHEYQHQHHVEQEPTLDEKSLPQTWALEDLESLDGQTNVYIEDVETGQRYGVAGGMLPSEVRAIYFTPTLHMVGTNAPVTKGSEPGPNTVIEKLAGRIILHARVETDLYKDGVILRFTGFSKPFYVERGAL